MLPVGMLLAWGGYGLSSWGWCLVKGYNITLRAWFSPLHPYQWPASGATVPTVPKGHLFPVADSGAQGSGGVVQPDSSGGGGTVPDPGIL